LTIVVDDAGMGDLLFGVVISAFRLETEEFGYETVDVKYFRPPRFGLKEYLKQASIAVFRLLNRLRLKADELIQICKGYKDLVVSFAIFIVLILLAAFIGVPGEPKADPSDSSYVPRPECTSYFCSPPSSSCVSWHSTIPIFHLFPGHH
jgi:hypothetical protein